MKFLKALFFYGLLVMTFGCSSQVIKADFDHGEDFSIYQEFEWAKKPASQASSRSPLAAHKNLYEKRLKAAIQNYLKAKNIVLATPSTGKVDFKIATHFNVGGKIDVKNWGYKYRGRYKNPNLKNETHLDQTLVIDFIDIESNQLIWRGWATGTVDHNPKKSEEKMKESVAKILSQFPPKK